MNLKEGTRRLALLLGVVGAILAGFVSYFQLQSTMRQRAEHQRFEQAAIRIEHLGKETQEKYSAYKDIDPSTLGWRVLVKYPQFWPWVSDHAKEQPGLPTPKQYLDDNGNPIPELPLVTQGKYTDADIASGADVQHSEPWEDANYDWRTLGIKTPDGQTLYSTPSPGPWSYAGIVLLPLLGFFIPWGAVRAVGWVGAGFAAGPK